MISLYPAIQPTVPAGYAVYDVHYDSLANYQLHKVAPIRGQGPPALR